QGSGTGSSGSGPRGPKTAVLIGCDKDGNAIAGTRTSSLRGFGNDWTTMDAEVREGRVKKLIRHSGTGADKAGGSGTGASGELPPPQSGYIVLKGEHVVI